MLRCLLEKHSEIIFGYLKLAAPDLVDFLLCLAGIVRGARGNHCRTIFSTISTLLTLASGRGRRADSGVAMPMCIYAYMRYACLAGHLQKPPPVLRFRRGSQPE